MAAALDGIERGLDPGEPVDQDPGNLTDKEREARGIRRFPLTSRRRSTSSRRTPC
jgi:glutamine synthetase